MSRPEAFVPHLELKSAHFTFSNMKGLPRLPWRNKLANIGMSSPFIN